MFRDAQQKRVYNPQEIKLNFETIIGYQKKSRGSTFYRPNNCKKIVETSTAKFFDNGEVSGSVQRKVVEIRPMLFYQKLHSSTVNPRCFNS